MKPQFEEFQYVGRATGHLTPVRVYDNDNVTIEMLSVQGWRIVNPKMYPGFCARILEQFLETKGFPIF